MPRLWVGSGLLCLAFVAAGCESAPEKLPDNFLPLAVSAVDSDTFWVLGRGGDGAALARTADGGETFTALPTPNLPPAMAAAEFTAIEYVLFADAENGWIYGSTLWSTHDGGENWTRLDAEDEDVTHVVGAEDFAYAIVHRDGTQLWRAPVDSDDWEQLDLELGKRWPTDLEAVDDFVAIAGGDTSVGAAAWISTDGGDTFTERETDCLVEHSEGELTIVDPDEIWLTCPTDSDAPRLWHVMVSTDHGTSWDFVYAHEADPDDGGVSWPMVTARDAGAATVADEGTTDLVHIGVGAEPEVVDLRGSPWQVTFATPDTGFVLTWDGTDPRGQKLLRTDDGGRTWNPVEIK